MKSELSDKQLIDQANKGDSEAFAKLYYRYRDWVYRLACRFNTDHHQVMDVMQETFHYLLIKLPDLELTARMTTFLYPVVKHLSLTQRNKTRRFQSIESNVSDLDIPAHISIDITESRRELSEALAILPGDQREVLLMRFVDDMSLDEIGTALEIPTGTVKSRLHRALKTLRDDPRTKNYFLG
ncbi:MAG: RNA polymerase sigma factor [Sedimentisphaerales bacterium]|nr:RNA polymerase sigma factor [Sedimentisphaerales bacterium]